MVPVYIIKNFTDTPLAKYPLTDSSDARGYFFIFNTQTWLNQGYVTIMFFFSKHLNESIKQGDELFFINFPIHIYNL